MYVCIYIYIERERDRERERERDIHIGAKRPPTWRLFSAPVNVVVRFVVVINRSSLTLYYVLDVFWRWTLTSHI